MTLCDPMDCSLPESSVHGIHQARILEWVAMPSSRNLPDPGIEPMSLVSPALQADSLPLVPAGRPLVPIEKLKDFSRIVLYTSWGTRTALKLNCFLMVFPLPLHSLTCTTSSSLSLLFRTQWSLGGYNIFPTYKNQGTLKAFVLGNTLRVYQVLQCILVRHIICW